jgi:hypothetical protein
MRKFDIRPSGRNWRSNIMVIKISLFKTLTSMQFDLLTYYELLHILFNSIYVMSNLSFVLKSINPLQLIYLTLLKRLPFAPSFIAKEWDWSVCCTERSRLNVSFVSPFPFGQILMSNFETFSESVLALPSENHASSNFIILCVFFLIFAWLPSTWLLLVIAIFTCFHWTVFWKCVPSVSIFWPRFNLARNSFHASAVLSWNYG